MSQSLAKVLVHIIYSTKNRKPWLRDPDLRSELYACNATILKNEVDSPAIFINGVEDHIHILCQLSRKFSIMNVINARGGRFQRIRVARAQHGGAVFSCVSTVHNPLAPNGNRLVLGVALPRSFRATPSGFWQTCCSLPQGCAAFR